MAQRSVPAPFLTKTYHLVNDPATDDVVSWNDDGTAFVVWKTAEFAKDLLPNYFKHNNFCSFVRQLNTYGFRKTVSAKWEFGNENFKRGQAELLPLIRRRKTQNSSPAGKTVAADTPNSAETSGDELGASNSTSSPDSKNPSSPETHASSAQIADLSGENEKLRKDNQFLSSELAQMKRQCDELIAFLTKSVKVAPDQISRIMDVVGGDVVARGDDDDDENENCMKLFGVVVKRRRERDGSCDFDSSQCRKEMKRSVGDDGVSHHPRSVTDHSPRATCAFQT